MTAPRLTHLPDVLEEHFDEVQFLWSQRQRALCSPEYTMRELRMLEERLEARVQGVLAMGDRALPMLDAALAGDDPEATLAAALVLLRDGTVPAARRVLDAFADAEGGRLDALRSAMCAVRSPHVAPGLPTLLRAVPTPHAAAAAEVLAVQTAATPRAGQIEWFARDESAAVRETAWRIVAQLALPVDAKLLAAGMRDDAAAVRRSAIAAAAWSGQRGLLTIARAAASGPTPDAVDYLHMLAVLGAAEDVPRLARVARAEELGSERFRMLGAFGHPAVVDLLLADVASADPATAAAAGEAFTKITGHDVDSGQRATAAATNGEPDAFDAEFADEVMVPDAERARRHWAEVRGRFAGTSRLCRGHDMGRQLAPDAFATLDMESRWELFLRARFGGTWGGSPHSLEQFPQR